MKGISNIVSVSLITGFIILAVAMTLIWAMPILDKSQKIAELERTKASMSTIDDYIRIVSHSGNSTTRTIFISIDKGKMTMTNSSITYDIDVGEDLIKSGVTIQEKNVWITGTGSSVQLKLNYSSIELSANDVVIGTKQIQIRKIGDKNNKPLVEVKAV
ncbi:hypothetical protein H0N95_01235 [Candidatus Micrarchaeota archaeon]|nr:hypothetical protein [Candidatus Micrarchaeota archaeon]